MNDTVTTVLMDSDAVCEGCGADPRVSDEQLERWHIDIVQTPDATLAVVRCPECW